MNSVISLEISKYYLFINTSVYTNEQFRQNYSFGINVFDILFRFFLFNHLSFLYSFLSVRSAYLLVHSIPLVPRSKLIWWPLNNKSGRKKKKWVQGSLSNCDVQWKIGLTWAFVKGVTERSKILCYYNLFRSVKVVELPV